MISQDREVLEGAIWLYKQNGEVSPALLAESLDVDEERVLQALRRLEKEELVEISSRLIPAEEKCYQPTETGIRRLMKTKELPFPDGGYSWLEDHVARGFPKVM